jgi:hypothetical protein
MFMQLSSFARRGLLGFISCLALLLGMVSFTATASAHTASPAQSASSRPHISVFFVERNFPRFGCVIVGVHGSKFHRDGRATLFASDEENSDFFVRSVGVSDNGTFNTAVRVCGFLRREDIFSRDRGCFVLGNMHHNANSFVVRDCFRQDSFLNNSPCFGFGADPELFNCFQQRQFFFFGGQIDIFARDAVTGRFSNTVSVDANFDNRF